MQPEPRASGVPGVIRPEAACGSVDRGQGQDRHHSGTQRMAPEGGHLIKGYWFKTWKAGFNVPPPNTNIGIAFSGWTDLSKALSESNAIKDSMTGAGASYLSLGGGNENGRWSQAALSCVAAAIESGCFADWAGLAYDVEVGDAGLEQAFRSSFAAAKAKGLSVLVTVSHTAPYGIADAASLMRAFLADPNIDLLSPQLYTTGTEGSNDFSTNHGMSWAEYAGAKPKLVPSIVAADYYASALSHFESHGVHLAGYLQWQT